MLELLGFWFRNVFKISWCLWQNLKIPNSIKLHLIKIWTSGSWSLALEMCCPIILYLYIFWTFICDYSLFFFEEFICLYWSYICMSGVAQFPYHPHVPEIWCTFFGIVGPLLLDLSLKLMSFHSSDMVYWLLIFPNIYKNTL